MAFGGIKKNHIGLIYIMRILLVDPPGRNKGLNTGLGYLSAVLKNLHEIRVLDLNNIVIGNCGDANPDMPEKVMKQRIKKALESFTPHVFGVSVKTFTAVVARNILDIAREFRPDMTTVVGGPHITLDGYKFIQESMVDFGIQGEGEYTFPELCNALDKEEVRNIEGVYRWDNGQLILNPKSSTIQDLDAIPFPCYENFSSIIDSNGTIKEYPLLSSRGCPYNCTYCSMPNIMGRKWRSHSPDRVIKELEHAKNKYHSTSFTVVDDNFTLNLKRVDNICNQLISKQINLPWNSQNGIRADRISAQMAKTMKRSGCHYVWIGIESADEKVFDAINKGERLEDIKKGIKHLKSAGIRVGGFFIVGLPYSTKEADLKSVDFVKELGIDGWWFNFVPYPHTQAYDWVQTNGKILRSSDGVLQFGTDSINPVFETDNYLSKDRIKTYDEIHIRMHYFDRLPESSDKSWFRWIKVLKKIAPYGPGTIFSFMIFLMKHYLKIVKSNLIR